MIKRLSDTYHKYPTRFWALILVVFIDMIGGTLLSPFFALYITQKFGVGMTQAGIMLGMFAFFGLFGNAIGGALTDRFGRKKIILFGLIFSALSTISLGFVSQYWLLFPLSAVIGILGSISGPAHNAMVADMLPPEQHNEGYGMIRVVANLSWIIGPTIGGFVASRSYLALFLMDAAFSLTTAMLVFKILPETMPQKTDSVPAEPFSTTLRGYQVVFRNAPFMAFLLVSMLMLLVYQQMYNTLSVYLRDVHQIPTTQYGYMLSASAVLVVLTQFWVSTQTKKFPPMAMMAFGCAFYMVGFSMFGYTNQFIWFLMAILIITVGEMITMPVSQALAAKFAPEEMRGRYMAIFSFSWAIPSSIGPGLAGLILDNADPRWVWFGGGLICAIAILGYISLHLRLRSKPDFQVQAAD